MVRMCQPSYRFYGTLGYQGNQRCSRRALLGGSVKFQECDYGMLNGLEYIFGEKGLEPYGLKQGIRKKAFCRVTKIHKSNYYISFNLKQSARLRMKLVGDLLFFQVLFFDWGVYCPHLDGNSFRSIDTVNLTPLSNDKGSDDLNNV